MDKDNKIKKEFLGKREKFINKYYIFSLISVLLLLFVLPIGIYIMNSAHTVAKPIIYLYPTEPTEVEVSLGYPEKLSCSYPEYDDQWNVLANPDGKLVDLKTGRKLYSLYWEGIGTTKYNLNEGFVVKGGDTLEFLEEKLAILGLNEYESEEFIVYWLPKMQNNKYNFIRFATMEEINEYMPLELSVEPDTLIRVLMQYKPLNKYMEVKEQPLTTVERNGFVVIEWGGSEIM